MNYTTLRRAPSKEAMVADNISVAFGIFRAPSGGEGQSHPAAVAETDFRDYPTMDLRSGNTSILLQFPELNAAVPMIGLTLDAYLTKPVSCQEAGSLFNCGRVRHSGNEDQMR
jgi:hypothetical protein